MGGQPPLLETKNQSSRASTAYPGMASSSAFGSDSGVTASSSSRAFGQSPWNSAASDDVTHSSAAHSHKESPNPNGYAAGTSSNQRRWLFLRMKELNIEFDEEVFWSVLQTIPKEQLGDMEVVKMWLGFTSEQELPFSIHCLVSEF